VKALRLAGNATEFILTLNGDDSLVGGRRMRKFLDARRGLTSDNEAMYLIGVNYGGISNGYSERVMRTRNHMVPNWPNDNWNHWRYEGSTHESYIKNKALNERADILYVDMTKEFHISHDISQDTKEKKNSRFLQDIDLLKADIKKMKETMPDYKQQHSYTRAVYYIAQSYHNLGQMGHSLQWYKRRVSLASVTAKEGEDTEKQKAAVMVAQILMDQDSPNADSATLGKTRGDIEKYLRVAVESCPCAFSYYLLALNYRRWEDQYNTEKYANLTVQYLKGGNRSRYSMCTGDDPVAYRQMKKLFPQYLHQIDGDTDYEL
jgi:hypothetical protein